MSEQVIAPPDTTLITDPPEPAPEAPYGYTRDKTTGEMRPKLRPGRGGRRPTGDDTADDTEPRAERKPDRAPDRKATARRVPAYKAGVIAAGMNRLYRRTGKIVSIWDEDIGEALILSATNTSNDPEEDDSVGYAWDQLAKVNPRVRAALLKMVTGGIWGQLIMAHLPIAVAIAMKPAIRDRIPFAHLLRAFTSEEDDGTTMMPGDLNENDLADMADMAQEHFASMGFPIDEETLRQAQAMAENLMGGSPVTVPGQVVTSRHQPRRKASRASR
jgi:hypothetical protein